MTRFCLALLALLTQALSTSLAQPNAPAFGSPADEWCREHGDGRTPACDVREETLKGLTSLQVDTGGNGSIAVRGWDRADVHLRARITARARSEADARAIASRVRISTGDGRVRADGPGSLGRRDAWAVAMELQIPRGLRIALDTTNGSLTAIDVNGAIDLRTVNGSILLSGAGGDIRGRTTSGSLDVRLSGDRWDGKGLDLRAENGGITLRVPARYSAELDLHTTHGGIDSNVPVLMRAGFSRERLAGTLGSGGALLRLSTINGGISVEPR